MIYFFLDCLVYNYTAYTSFFFLETLNKRGIIYIFALAFMLDFIVLKTWFLHILLLPLFYVVKKYLFVWDARKFIVYLATNLFFVICYYLITSFFYSSIQIKVFLSMLLVNTFFYAICYIKDKSDIKLCRVR